MYTISKKAHLRMHIDGKLEQLTGELNTQIVSHKEQTQVTTSLFLCPTCPVQQAFREALLKGHTLTGAHPVTHQHIRITPTSLHEYLPNEYELATGTIIFDINEITP